MRTLLLTTLSILFCSALFGQMEPVKWTFDAQKVNEKEYDIVFTAKIDDGWAVYSQYLESDQGPVPTSIEFDAQTGLQLIGKASENGNKKEAFDSIFGMNLTKFSDRARITQRVKVDPNAKSVKGFLTFMTCDDKSCLPPTDVDFDIVLASD